VAEGGAMVIGIGNPDRGDDGAGVAVARAVQGVLAADVRVRTHDGEASGLLDCLTAAPEIYLVDACRSGEPAGTVRRWDLSAGALPAAMGGTSTHGLGVAEAVELARALGQLPARCVAYTIEGAVFDVGAGLSSAVADAAQRVAGMLGAEIAARRREVGHA